MDTCFAGRTLDSVDLQTQNQINPFIFASSNGLQTAFDDGGGYLANALGKLLTAQMQDACKVDLDGDGEISQQELATVLVGAFLNANSILRPLKESSTRSGSSNPRAQHLEDVDFRQLDHQSQTPVSAPTHGQCFLRIQSPHLCLQANGHSSQAPICTQTRQRVSALRATSERIRQSGGLRSHFAFMNPDVGQSEAGVIRSSTTNISNDMMAGLEPEESLSPEARAINERRAQIAAVEVEKATRFIRSWKMDLEQQTSLCLSEFANELSSDCHRSNLAHAGRLLKMLNLH